MKGHKNEKVVKRGKKMSADPFLGFVHEGGKNDEEWKMGYEEGHLHPKKSLKI